MRVLLVSTYELGHQPVHVASPAAALRANGHDVRAVDVSVEPWNRFVEWADRIAFSVPMHTAMRMAVTLAASVRAQRPDLPVCLYGLYAGMGRGSAEAGIADRVIIGEYEPALLSWVDGTGAARASARERPAPLWCTSAAAGSPLRHASVAAAGALRQARSG